MIATAATITMNVLANALPLNGQPTGAISDRFPVLVTPAGYVFSIWGVIYLGLIGYTIYQALPAQRANARLAAVAPLYMLSCAANIVWLLLWHYNFFTFTQFAMVGLLVALIAVWLRLDRGTQGLERWLVNLPFSIYLGWISVATIVNTTVVLYNLGLRSETFGISEQLLTAVLLLVGAGLALRMALSFKDIAYALVIAWAFAGIALKHADTTLLAPFAWVMVAIIVIGVIGSVWRGGGGARQLAVNQ
ncbi:tryptophan-rich sensory protein [Candidatus Gracilibacteria bacterium]|nr:tryptophan-rich sensory protein [Candidatus Gracilibacteria bacterium]